MNSLSRYLAILATLSMALFVLLVALIGVAACREIAAHRTFRQAINHSLREPTPLLNVEFVAWHLALMTLAIPIVWIVVRVVLRALRPVDVGRCRRCNYDLRATPDRCPECGTIPAKT